MESTNDESDPIGNALSNPRLAFLILVSVGGLMTLMSWQRSGDVLINYGEQIYISWRIFQGEVLYKDIVHFHGPLSIYIHSLIFKIFGPNLLVLNIFNALLIGYLARVIYDLFSMVGNRLVAFNVALIFLTVFAFAQYVTISNYNFLTPYVYELTHGVLLSFLILQQLARYIEDPKLFRIFITGGYCGLTFLLKVEVFLAIFTSAFIGLALILKFRQESLKNILNGAFFFILAFIIPSSIFILYFSQYMLIAEAFNSVFLHWIHLFSTSMGQNPFYQHLAGTNDITKRIFEIITYGIVFFFLCGVLFFSNHLSRRIPGNVTLVSVLFSSSIVLLIYKYIDTIPWFQVLRPLPLILLIILIYQFSIIFNSQSSSEKLKGVLNVTITLFSLILLLKIIFNSRVYHYGFALALPGTLIVTKHILFDLPNLGSRFSKTSRLLKYSILVFLFAFIFVHVKESSSHYVKKVFPIGQEADTLYVYGPGKHPAFLIFQMALDHINLNFKPDDNFSVLPMGGMLNFLSKRKSPIKYTIMDPVTLERINDADVLKALKSTPPDYLVIIGMEFSEFGYSKFGIGFGETIYQWVKENYQRGKLFGNDPVDGEGFGILFYKHNQRK